MISNSVLPTVSSHLSGAKGNVKILLRKRDETTLDNLGKTEKKAFKFVTQPNLECDFISFKGGTQEHLTVILSFVLLYVFPVA